MPRDTYVRISGSRRVVGAAPSGAALLFVDLPVGDDLVEIREIAPEFLEVARDVVVRSDDIDVARVDDFLRRLGYPRPAAHVLRHAPGQRPTLQSLRDLEATAESALISRARGVEIETLLSTSGAIWNPKNFHFALPSGHHSQGFVKLAQTLRHPRDAEVFALWMTEFTPPGTAIVVDTAGMTPVLLALELILLRQGQPVPGRAVLDQYPPSSVDVRAAIDEATTDADNILCAISVNASGTLKSKVVDALERSGARFSSPTVVCLVDLVGGAEPRGGVATHALWRSRSDLGAATRSWAVNCELCRDPDRAAVVPIDPVTYDAVFPTLVQPRTPMVSAPRRNSTLWEACCDAGALSAASLPDPHIQPFRAARRRLALKVDLTRLVQHPPLAAIAATRLRDALSAEVGSKFPESFDLVLVVGSDRERDGFLDFWEAVRSSLHAPSETIAVDPALEWGDDTEARVREASRILIFTVGMVTGGSLHRMLASVQAIKQDANYDRWAVVLHGRPESPETWPALQNAFDRKIVRGWWSLLPDHCPLEEEHSVLGIDMEVLETPVRTFLETRGRLCSGELNVSEVALLWGTALDDRISPHSIYGNRLRVVPTYVAVANAVHERRKSEVRAPTRSVFDIRLVAESYYDPIILACMFRWMRPHEIWWGERVDSAEAILCRILERATETRSRTILLSELLLASALGKVPTSATGALVAHAEAWVRARRDGNDAPESWIPVSAGLAVAELSASASGTAAGSQRVGNEMQPQG